MAEKEKNSKEEYRQVRDAFDSLKIEEKAVFLVESAFSMLAHGIEAIGSVFSEQINKMHDETEEEKKESSAKAKKTTRKRATSSRSKKSNTKSTSPKAED